MLDILLVAAATARKGVLFMALGQALGFPEALLNC